MRIASFIVMATVAVAGCAPPDYRMPGTGAAAEKEIVVDAPFREAWRALVDHAGSTFFSIDGFDRSSGLMTLSFGAGQPGRFIDCGFVEATNLSGEAGPFVHLAEVSPVAATNFVGRMNVLVRELPDRRTRLTVTARYVYEVRTDSWSNTWAFDSQGSDTKPVVAGFATYPVTCRPTGEAERSVLEGVAGATAPDGPAS